MKFFMQKPKYGAKYNKNWGICKECCKASTYMLCRECVIKRDEFHFKEFEDNKSSIEYRIRLFLTELFDPEQSKRY